LPAFFLISPLVPSLTRHSSLFQILRKPPLPLPFIPPLTSFFSLSFLQHLLAPACCPPHFLSFSFFSPKTRFTRAIASISCGARQRLGFSSTCVHSSVAESKKNNHQKTKKTTDKKKKKKNHMSPLRTRLSEQPQPQMRWGGHHSPRGLSWGSSLVLEAARRGSQRRPRAGRWPHRARAAPLGAGRPGGAFGPACVLR
jgi:hypothetical protein